MSQSSRPDQARELKREEVEEFRREALNGWAVECEAIVQLCDLALRSFQSSDERSDTVLLPRELTAENGMKAALSGEFSFDIDGGERYVVVPWDTIKKIHRKVVEPSFRPTP